MGSDLDVHTVTFDGNQFSEKGKHRDGRQLVPGSTAALSMGADNIGEYSYTYPADNVSIFTPCRIVFKIFQRRFFEKRHLSERISYFLFFRYYCACKKNNTCRTLCPASYRLRRHRFGCFLYSSQSFCSLLSVLSHASEIVKNINIFNTESTQQ